MDRREKKERRGRVAGEVRVLRGILHEWEPVGFATPADEYDDLIGRLLSVLHAGGGEDDLASKVERELDASFGGGLVPEGEIRSAAATIWQWWQSAVGPDGGEGED